MEPREREPMGLKVGIVVMAKLPSAGDPKSRLGTLLTREQRIAFQSALLSDALARARSVAATYLAFTPPDAAEEAMGYAGVQAFPDEGADLGERMASAAGQVLARGHEGTIVVGTDCPYLAAGELAEAAAQLREVGVSLGPALDGGYYLIGLRRLHRGVFMGVPWRSPLTLAATIERVLELGLTYRLGRPLPDVDTPADFHELAWSAAGLGRREVHSPRVTALLRSWYPDLATGTLQRPL